MCAFELGTWILGPGVFRLYISTPLRDELRAIGYSATIRLRQCGNLFGVDDMDVDKLTAACLTTMDCKQIAASD